MSLLLSAISLLLLACETVGQGGQAGNQNPTQAVLLDNITSGCGATKGCFYFPSECSSNVSLCTYVATWKARVNDTAHVEEADVELWSLNRDGVGTRYQWASVVFSENDILDEDDVLGCQVEESTVVSARDFFTPQLLDSGPSRQDSGVVDVTRTLFYEADQYFYCSFKRAIQGTSPAGQDHNLSLPHFLLFARGANFNRTAFDVTEDTVLATSPRRSRVVDYVVVNYIYPDLTLIKVHGSFMIFAFLFLLPIGIILSAFYKIVWPNGGWFFAHIVIMLLTLIFTLVGFIVIFVHAMGSGQPRFLQTTNVGIAHGVFGIIAFCFLLINPIVGLAKGDPNNKWRKYFFKPIHGAIGLLFVATIGMTNLLLGLNRMAALVSEGDFWIVRASIYFCAGTIGVIVTVMALYNVYHITFQKRVLDPNASVQLLEEDIGRLRMRDENIIRRQEGLVLKPSKDYIPRTLFLGVYIIGLLILVGIVLGLFNYTTQRAPSTPMPGFVGF